MEKKKAFKVQSEETDGDKQLSHEDDIMFKKAENAETACLRRFKEDYDHAYGNLNEIDQKSGKRQVLALSYK